MLSLSDWEAVNNGVIMDYYTGFNIQFVANYFIFLSVFICKIVQKMIIPCSKSCYEDSINKYFVKSLPWQLDTSAQVGNDEKHQNLQIKIIFVLNIHLE